MDRSRQTDTSPDAQRRYTEHMRSRTPADRARILAGLCSAVRRLAEVGVRAAHPDASPREVEAWVAVRLYGLSTAQRFFPDVDLR
jgi:hypothetical protein